MDRLSIGPGLLILLMACVAWQSRAGTITYDITGKIDTSDLLIVHRGSLQWHHDNGGAAVGRHGGTNDPTTISAKLDGVSKMTAVNWTPTWSLDPPDPIRFDAFSSTFNTLVPALPTSGIVSVTPSTISGRGTVTITQQPDATNDWTLIAPFADGANGDAILDGQILITTVPEPAGTAFLLMAMLIPGLPGRRGYERRR